MSRSPRRGVGSKGRLVRREEGQAIVIVTICLLVFIGMLGLVIDVGRLYVVQRHLQTAVDAAALAAGQDLPDGTTAQQTALDYGGGAGGKNEIFGQTVTTTDRSLRCLSVQTAGVSCLTGPGCQPPDFPNGCNAIRVTEQVDVTPWFMGVFGIGSRKVTATATASMAGGVPHPLDIEVVVDRTPSMSDKCSSDVAGVPNTSTTPTKLDCAKAGIRALLGTLFPCQTSYSICQASGPHNVVDAVDRVGLIGFEADNKQVAAMQPDPTGVVLRETDCVDNVTPSDVTYTSGSTIYPVIPLSSDYRTSDTAASLNKDSSLVKSVWWKACPGGVYPYDGGGGNSSIVGGASGDRSGASNGAGIAGGPAGSSDRSGASNGAGIAGGPAGANDRSGASNAAVVAGGPGGTNDRSGANNGAGIAGGPGGANDRSGASTSAGSIGGGPGSSSDRSGATNGSGGTSISVNRPATRVDGDFLLVSVTAQGALTNVCAPNDGTWTLVRQDTQGSGSSSITQATFRSFRSGTSAETYSFTFRSGACPAGGSLVAGILASAVAVRYTGVDPTSPIDPSANNPAANLGNGITLTAPSVTTTSPNDQVVRLYGTGDTSLSNDTFDQSGSSTTTGIEDSTQAAPGATGTATACSGAFCIFGGANWVAQTVALRGRQTDTSISIDRPATRVDGDFLLVSVTAKGLGGGNVCAPDNTWTLVRQDAQGTVTEATFRSFRAGTGAETYTFTFRSGACPAGGSLVSVSASAVAVRYTGVDPTTPLDPSAANPAATTGTGTALTAPAVTASVANDRVVRLFGTGATSFSGNPTFNQTSGSTASLVTDAAGPAAGASTGTATATGGSSADWVAQTVLLRDSRTSITVSRPATRVDGDFLLVSVTAEGLGGGNVCAPNDGTWTLVRQDAQGSVTEATFRSFRVGTGAETYTFTFRSGACPAGGSLVPGVAASAVAVRYTGVDPASPLDPSPTNPAANTGTGTALTAPAVTASVANDRVVRLFGTGATSFSGNPTFNQAGSSTATLVTDAAGPAAGASTGTATATSGSSADWVAQTIALNTRASITIDRPPNRSDADFLLVSVTAQNLNGGTICPPNDGSWTQVLAPRQQPPSGSPSITQATFYSIRGTTDDEHYRFDFRTSCSGGSSIAAAASAVAVRYTGVDLLTPIDPTANNPAANAGSGSTLTAPSVTASANDQVVRFYSTGAASLSNDAFDQSGSSTATGFEDAPQASNGSTGTASATSSSSSNWVAQTIALKAAGPGCQSSCYYGLQAPAVTGFYTYYADAINAAQQALLANARPGAQKVIILLSDGDANIMGPKACHAGINAAESAETPRSDGSTTWVFAIAWNASNNANSSCSTDRQGLSPQPISALCTMHMIADNPVTNPPNGTDCSDNATDARHRFYNQPTSGDLTDIFQSIGTSLASTRLVSNDAT